ncbi:methyltransferase [Salinimicrobium marinum]|uniref:Methyltransferase n=1 Tax=Salinimicrobium marinum TaxID=680283 RepID=A0A918SMV5_9FLAO|nr:class I SAM-dependent methyltransferase [Salinimicrobium marinum]GHA50642.1 methyltransferase [Salinimicrobium marinum]
MAKTLENWFSSWFDTPYYHILYRDRGYEEAGLFMKNLTSFLRLPKGSTILDLACGKGRHSLFLSKLDFEVTGVDLSQNSIEFAKQFENSKLHFQVHDMCKPMDKEFDAVFNLFTSFGYFEAEEDNFRTIKAIKEELKEEGHGVIDFMNVKKVIRNLIPSEVKTVKGIDFRITRNYHGGYILKNIAFHDEDESYNFTEKVKALTLEDFKEYFDRAGINLKHIFGSYQLEKYDEKESDRLILVFSK